jgi:acetyltransferase-like isoleucine patch superfamily enzyme
MRETLVSVIIAVYNGASEIAATIESALDQDYASLEIIVIDGGSTDGTTAIIARYQHRLAHFVSEHDRGIGDAWNKGLGLCNGGFVAILNCGDSWPTSFVSSHLITLSEQPRAIQYGNTYMTIGGFVVDRVDRDFDPELLVDGFGFMHTSIMTSKAVYDEVGLFSVEKHIAVDSDWLLRAFKSGVIFRRIQSFNFMSKGGVSSRYWLRGQFEYIDSLISYGVISKKQAVGARHRKRLQSIWLRSGLHRLKRRFRMQWALIAVALINAVCGIFPPYFIRRLAWRVAGVNIHRSAVVHQRVRLMALRRLRIGEGSVVNYGVLLDNRDQISIGKNVSISHSSRIYTTGHDIDSPDFSIKTSPVCIEDFAVLFAGAVIMPGVNIGRGAVVLPFSVVTKDVAALSVVGGVPAEVKGVRRVEPRYRLDYGFWFAQ